LGSTILPPCGVLSSLASGKADLLLEASLGLCESAGRSGIVIKRGVVRISVALDHNHGSATRRLLVVDDEDNICQVLEQYFSLKGYEVRAVHRGDEALALAGVFHPDVVLLDLLIPGMNGIDTLRALKQLIPAPKVLMMSAADHEEVVQGALDLGVDFYMCKPIDLSKLDHLVNGFCPPKH